MSEEKLLNPEEQTEETPVAYGVDEKDESRGRIKEPKWYVVHTYSGHENKVKVNLERLVENQNMQDLVLQVVVPTETVYEHKDGTPSKARERKIFPGYVIVKMIVTNESWYLVRNTQGVTGFVGHGSEPIPLSDEEVRRMGIEKTVVILNVNVGDCVRIISGPFKGFSGLVEEVNGDKQTLKTKVDMFGRSTPVELEFDQVEKI
ncbi:MAG: transcription termination/antitermination protein NusG [Clostridia bacterium]|nr:transcription termination/antitermination protein NusG [Clostridia bacterium]